MSPHPLVVFFLFIAGAVQSGDAQSVVSYVGCFDVQYSLTQHYHQHIPGISFSKCTTKCSDLNKRYAGIDASTNFCYCGDDLAESSVKRADFQCPFSCRDGGVSRTCGGEWLMSLYQLPTPSSTVGTEKNLNFLLGLSAGVRLYNMSNMDRYDVILNTTEWANALDYHYEKNLAFAVSKGKIHRTPLRASGVQSEPLTVSVATSCDAMAVDWVHDKVFWVKCDLISTNLMSMGLNGNGTKMVMRREGESASIRRMVIDPYAGMLFWTADGVIESYDVSEDNFRTNISQSETSVRGLAVDLAGRRLYYVGTVNHSTSLFSVDYEGEDLREHFKAPQLRSIYGLGLHAGQVYWVNYANVKDIIYSAPVDLQNSDEVKPLKVIDKAVWHMKVVHQEMQKPPKKDPCEVKNCTHDCLKVNYFTAQCQCPDHMILLANGIVCMEPVAAKKLVAESGSGMLTVGLLVVVVLLVSALLLYLFDTYWSPLQSKLRGVPYQRNRESPERESSITPEYSAAQDNVLLV